MTGVIPSTDSRFGGAFASVIADEGTVESIGRVCERGLVCEETEAWEPQECEPDDAEAPIGSKSFQDAVIFALHCLRVAAGA